MALILGAIILGSVWGSLLGCVPGLHIYTVLGALVGCFPFFSIFAALPALVVGLFFLTMIITWSLLNSIPSILLAAPDESALFTVLPGQSLALRGRAREAIDLTLMGGVIGFIVFILLLGASGYWALPALHRVLRLHYSWILWSVIGFMLLSEWPRGTMRGPGGWRKLAEGWMGLSAGLLTFILSGLLGFIVMYDGGAGTRGQGSNLVPAFVGLFAMPGLLMTGFSSVRLPAQRLHDPVPIDSAVRILGVGAGFLGGCFAAYFPGVTGGMGGLLSGHAVGIREDRSFLLSQGASKTVYYGGGFLLLWTPGFERARGGGAALFRSLGHGPGTVADFAVLLSGSLAAVGIGYLLGGPLIRGSLRLLRRLGYRRASGVAMSLLILVVGLQTGAWGLGILLVATAIGLLPLLFGARRMNALGVILLPLACNLAGYGARIADALGLLKL
jgi:putative membrane protein